MSIKSLLTAHELKGTSARIAALQILSTHHYPVDAVTLLKKMEEQGVKVNRTTVFRMLDDFLKKRLVTRHEFGQGKYSYEFAGLPHHHHAVCTSCKLVVELPDCLLEDALDKVSLPNKFTLIGHTLEFYGLCHQCRQSVRNI